MTLYTCPRACNQWPNVLYTLLFIKAYPKVDVTNIFCMRIKKLPKVFDMNVYFTFVSSMSLCMFEAMTVFEVFLFTDYSACCVPLYVWGVYRLQCMLCQPEMFSAASSPCPRLPAQADNPTLSQSLPGRQCSGEAGPQLLIQRPLIGQCHQISASDWSVSPDIGLRLVIVNPNWPLIG